MDEPLTVMQKIALDIENCNILDEKQKVQLRLKQFNKYISWNDEDYLEYDKLLGNLEKEKRKRKVNTTRLGKALEDIVTFIFEKSYFYSVYPNRRSSTHEIDQFVTLNDDGIVVLNDLKIPKKLLITEQDYFLCECKNYNKKVSATWVGKFNSLLEVSGKCTLGIIFSCNGLTGQENNWYDSHGLTKIIYHLSPKEQKRYIIDFNLEDFRKLRNRNINLFDIIQSKKKALYSNVKSEKLINDLHEGLNDVKKIYDDLKKAPD